MKQGIFIRFCMVSVVFLLLSVFVPGRVYAGICPTPPCVDSVDIIAGEVKTPDIGDGQVTTPKLGAGAVTTGKIKNNAVTGAKVLDGSLTGADIQDGSLGSADIANGAVSSADIAAGACGTTQIADGSVGSIDVGFNYAGSSSKGGKATDADLLDGLDSADFAPVVHVHDRSNFTCQGNSVNDKMVKVGPLCVDRYEASIWSNPDGTGTPYGVLTGQTAYPSNFPANGNWYWTGKLDPRFYAVSKPGGLPSTGVTWFQAQQACALSGKRLLTNAEWQMAAAGTPDSTACNVSSSATANTGSFSSCVSNWGVYDMVGNVWKWVADWMQGPNGNGVYGSWDTGAALTSSATYGNDGIYGINEAYPYTDRLPAALMRGGSWGGTGAGIFALAATGGPSDSDFWYGFRCAR